jgi:hypothetical protein
VLENFERLKSRADPEWESYSEGLLELTRVPLDKRPSVSGALRVSDIAAEVIETARSITRSPHHEISR